jgi:hypothetical protein
MGKRALCAYMVHEDVDERLFATMLWSGFGIPTPLSLDHVLDMATQPKPSTQSSALSLAPPGKQNNTPSPSIMHGADRIMEIIQVAAANAAAETRTQLEARFIERERFHEDRLQQAIRQRDLHHAQHLQEQLANWDQDGAQTDSPLMVSVKEIVAHYTEEARKERDSAVAQRDSALAQLAIMQERLAAVEAELEETRFSQLVNMSG